MQRLFNFIIQNRAFFTFIALEILCSWLIVQNNSYLGAQFFNSSNAIAANVMGVSQGVSNYLHLKVVNKELADENARLRDLLEKKIGLEVRDSAIEQSYDYVQADVVNNSVSLFRNFLTVNIGERDGIAPGMAVINSNRAVGKVKVVSSNFAVVISLLNLDEYVSATIKRTGNFGTIRWDGTNPRITTLQFIPRHVSPVVGDTIVTSGYNSIFPPGVLVGVVSKATLPVNGPWEIDVLLAQDFSLLQHVEVVRSIKKNEVDSIQNALDVIR